MEALMTPKPMDSRFIDRHNYFLSLVKEAGRVNLIERDQLMSIQDQLMDLLRGQVYRYNGGNSSSIKVERAESLLLSVLYTLNTSLLSHQQPESAVAFLRAEPLYEHYQHGIHTIKNQFNQTKTLYHEVLKNRIENEVVAYNDTLDQAIPEFFASYDFRYQAHEIPASIDYQLACPVAIGGQGINYINEYLQHLWLENQFCKLYPAREINRLLTRYGQIYRIDYPEYLLNIFEIVFTNAVLAEVLGSVGKLNLTSEAVGSLYQCCEGLTEKQIASMIDWALEKMMGRYGSDGRVLLEYIQAWLPQWLPRLYLALRQYTLDKLLITNQLSPRVNSVITLEAGAVLNNEDFRELTERITACPTAEDKVRIILSHIQSWSDFYDVLNADCLYGDEYMALFGCLGDLELSIIIEELGAMEIREGVTDIRQLIENLAFTEGDWQRALIKYFSSLRPERLESINHLIICSINILD